MEILNYHSHSDNNITVKVKEFTENQLLYEMNYIINITQVTVETYSDSGTGIPGYANITIKDQDVVLITSKSVFNIMKHSSLRLMSILKQDEMEETEYLIGKNCLLMYSYYSRQCCLLGQSSVFQAQ